MLVCSYLCGQTAQDSGHKIRILTFNILHGATTQNNFDLDIIAEVIREAQPDLVALQEVDFLTVRAKNLDLATELGWRVKMASLFAEAMPYDGGSYGEAVLSKYPFISSRKVPLPHRESSEPRAALEVCVVIPQGDTVCLIGTHLDHLADDVDRIAQVEAINQAFAHPAHPTILAGDLNAQPQQQPIQVLSEFWQATFDHPDPTYPSNNPRKKIDYILTDKNHTWETEQIKVICDSIASDHCAYLAVLKLVSGSRAKERRP